MNTAPAMDPRRPHVLHCRICSAQPAGSSRHRQPPNVANSRRCVFRSRSPLCERSVLEATMSEEYDPDGFSLRISPSLFQVLSGRAAEPGPIEPRTPREASLIEAVRKEGRRERAAMFRDVKEAHLKEAHDLEQAERIALAESGKKLQDKLASLNFTGPASPATQPCASFREAITVCYKVNGKDNPLACVAEVEAFTECAKQLSRISH